MMRNKLLAVYCIFSLTFPAGCVRSTASEWGNREARRVYHRASPSEFAHQVRAVSSSPQEIPRATPDDDGGKTADETESLIRLLEAQPENASALRRLAEAYLAGGHFELALERYRALRRLVAENAEIELALARVYEGLGNDGLALRHAQLAASFPAPSVEALEQLANLQHRRKDHAKAVEFYLAALRQAPGKLSLLVSLGEAHLRLKQWSEARSYLAEAAAIDASRRDVQRNLALAEICLGRSEQAIQHLVSQRVGPAAFNQLGLSLMQLGLWREARRVFKQALSLNPNDVQAVFNYKEADSYISPPTVVKLPSFNSVPTAAVDLAPRSDPSKKARAQAEPIAVDGNNSVVELQPRPALQPEIPPASAAASLMQEAAQSSTEVEPLVFLREPTEAQEAIGPTEETEAEPRLAQVTIPRFEKERVAPPGDSPARQASQDHEGELSVEALVIARSGAALGETASEDHTIPAPLGRPPTIVDLSWRNIFEAAAGIVTLPAGLAPATRTSLRWDRRATKPALPESQANPESQPGVAIEEENRPEPFRRGVEHLRFSFDPLGMGFFGSSHAGWPADLRQGGQPDSAESAKLQGIAGNDASNVPSSQPPAAPALDRRASASVELFSKPPLGRVADSRLSALIGGCLRGLFGAWIDAASLSAIQTGLKSRQQSSNGMRAKGQSARSNVTGR